MTDIFRDIYRRNLWAGRESRSGPGSGLVPTATVAAELTALVEALGARDVLDAACGDSIWMPDLPGYVGLDVVPEAIVRARRAHPDRVYLVGDVRQIHPGPDFPFDLVIVRDAIQHLPLVDGLAVLAALRLSGARWLLASTFVDGSNVSIVAGDAYRPNLEAAPFSMGPPERTIFDGYGYEDGTAIRDPGKFLGLWAL